MAQAMKNALQALDKAVEKLEAEYVIHEQKIKIPKSTQQHDLFSANVNTARHKPEAAANLNTEAMAQALDNTIARVERLLGEGRVQNG